MKTFLLLLLLTIMPGLLATQNILPVIALRNTDGENVPSTQIMKADQAYIMIFWKSYSTKCCDNLENMQSAWLSQLKEKGVEMVAICIDCNGAWNYIKPFVNGKAWQFEIYLDSNGDFKRAMGVTEAPFTLLFDKNHREICRHAGYCSGNEDMVCQKILHCLSETAGSLGVQANADK